MRLFGWLRPARSQHVDHAEIRESARLALKAATEAKRLVERDGGKAANALGFATEALRRCNKEIAEVEFELAELQQQATAPVVRNMTVQRH